MKKVLPNNIHIDNICTVYYLIGVWNFIAKKYTWSGNLILCYEKNEFDTLLIIVIKICVHFRFNSNTEHRE